MNRRTVLSLLLATAGSLSAQAPKKPSGPASIVRLKTPVVLDGSAAEWSSIPPTTISDATGRASFRLGFDAENFYAFVEVSDASPLRNSAARPQEMLKGGDAVSFYFNDPKAGPQRVLIGLLEGQTLIYAHRPKSKEKQPYVFSSPVGQAPFDFVGPLPEAKAVLLRTVAGYVAEISLPWSSLGFKQPSAALGFDFQVIFSDPAGSVNVGALWWHATSGPGLTVEDLPTEARLYPETWGEAVLVEKAPISAAVVPPGADRSSAPAAASISLDLPRDGRLTVAITDERGWIYRELIRAESYTAGKHAVAWDGRDRYGDVLPAGNYRWKAILFDGVGMKFLGSVGNSARPPYRTEDGLGSLGGQHGANGTVAADAGGIYIGGGAQEGEPAFRKINATTGAAIWKRSPGSFQSVVAASADEGYAILLNTKGKSPDLTLALVLVDPATGLTTKIGTQSEIDIDAPAKGTADVAISGGRAFFSVPGAKRIGGIDLKTGAKLPDIALEAWGLQRVDEKTLLACTKDSVVRLDVATGRSTPLVTGLVQPRDVALDPKTGEFFVSDLGTSQQIKKFSASGKLLAAYGRPGGKPASMPQYDPLAFDNITGLVVAPDGTLWMKEASPTPKRFIHLTADGRWIEDLCGPVAYNAFGPDLDDTSTIFYNATHDTPRFIETRVNYAGYAADPAKAGNWSITAIHDLSLGIDAVTVNPVMGEVAQTGYGHVVAFKASNGKRFLFRLSKFNRAAAPAGAGLWVWEKGRWIPALFICGDEKKENGLSWRDTNGDGLVQENERFSTPRLDRYSWIDRDMVLHGLDGLLAPASFDKNGLPVYENGRFTPHLKEASPYLESGNTFASTTVDGSIYYGVNWGPHRHLAFWDRATDNRLVKVTDGKIQWMTGIHTAKGGFAEFSTMSGIAGIVDDMVVVHNVEPSSFITYTTDGLVLGDASTGPNGKKPNVGPTAVYIESFTGLLVKDAPTGRRMLFFVVSGDDRIVELTGPGRTQRFEGAIALPNGSSPAGAGVPVIPYSSWYGNVSRGIGIDGEDTEWDPSVPRLSLSRQNGPVADVRFRRDAGSLFMIADVLDPTPLEAGEGIELDLGRTDKRAEVTIAITAPAAPSKGKWSGSATLSRDGNAKSAPEIKVAASKRWESLGYRLEAEIPLALLPEFSADRSQTFQREAVDPRTGKLSQIDKQTAVRPDLKAPLFLNLRALHLEAGALVPARLSDQGLIPATLP